MTVSTLAKRLSWMTTLMISFASNGFLHKYQIGEIFCSGFNVHIPNIFNFLINVSSF